MRSLSFSVLFANEKNKGAPIKALLVGLVLFSTQIFASCSEDAEAFLGLVDENYYLYDSYLANHAEINPAYKSHPQFEELSHDPDHNMGVTEASLLEAVAGIEAMAQGILPPNIQRGPKMTEFVDSEGRFWDVKKFLSPNYAVRQIKKKFGNVPGIYILLDISYITLPNLRQLRINLARSFSPAELARIKEVYIASPLVPVPESRWPRQVTLPEGALVTFKL